MGAITLAKKPSRNVQDLMQEKCRLNWEIFEDKSNDHDITELKKIISIRTNERDRAMQCVEKLHREHQALCANFKLLREKYDDVKVELQDVLWNYIPSLETQYSELGKPNPSVFETPTSIEHYSIGQLLGRGQFSDVKLTTCRVAKKDYAVKVVRKQKVKSMAALTRVLNELSCIKRLDHPNIVKFVDVIHSPTCLYLFLEIGGKDLFEFFDANPLGVDEHIAKQVMLGISTAVDYLHNEAHICHRDLKPENILLMEGSDTSNVRHYHVRVCDFGHSARYEKGKEFFDLCGSPGFFAPEMILSSGPRYDGLAADIWSIGCIMLELIRGHDEFCTCWMSAYDYDILQDESAFEHSLKSALDVIQNQRKESIICNDSSTFMEEFLVKLLELEPTNRLTASEIVKHPWFQFRDVRSAKMCHCPSGSETKTSKIPAHERDRLCNSFSLEARKQGCDSYEEKSTGIELKHHRVGSKSVSFPLKGTEASLSSNIPDTPSIKAVQKSVLECEKLVRSIQYNADD